MAGRKYDVFISHSGKQKDVARSIYSMLTAAFYYAFLDVDSLPPGENVYKNILEAAKTSRLAIVLLTYDFLSSKWPMVELLTFIDAGVKILPLFYLLSPHDLSDEDLLGKLQKKWEEIESKAPAGCIISVSKCSDAVRVLKRQGGLEFDKSKGAVSAYLNIIFSTISRILSPSRKFANLGTQGKDRLCKRIMGEFEKMESSTNKPRYVLGLYGPSGSGKSELSKCLCYDQFTHFDGKVLYLDLPSNPTKSKVVSKLMELFKLTNDYWQKTPFQELSEVVGQLKLTNLSSCRVFLVIDNVSSNIHSIEFVEAILFSGVLGVKSRVMLVARTLDDLLIFGHGVCQNIRVPSIDEKEALQVALIHGLGMQLGLEERLPQGFIDKLAAIVHEQQQSPYCPSEWKDIGRRLRRCGIDKLILGESKWQNSCVDVHESEKEYEKMIFQEIFETPYENLQNLFRKVACFLVSYFVKCMESSTQYGEKSCLKHDEVKTAPSANSLEVNRTSLTQIESLKELGLRSISKLSIMNCQPQLIRTIFGVLQRCQLNDEWIRLKREVQPRILRESILLVNCWKWKDGYLWLFSCVSGMDMSLVIIWIKFTYAAPAGFASSMQWLKVLENRKFQCMTISYDQFSCLAEDLHQSFVESCTAPDELVCARNTRDCANLWKLSCSSDNSTSMLEGITKTGRVNAQVLAAFLTRVWTNQSYTGCNLQIMLRNMKIIEVFPIISSTTTASTEFSSMPVKLDGQVQESTRFSLRRKSCKILQVDYNNMFSVHDHASRLATGFKASNACTIKRGALSIIDIKNLSTSKEPYYNHTSLLQSLCINEGFVQAEISNTTGRATYSKTDKFWNKLLTLLSWHYQGYLTVVKLPRWNPAVVEIEILESNLLPRWNHRSGGITDRWFTLPDEADIVSRFLCIYRRREAALERMRRINSKTHAKIRVPTKHAVPKRGLPKKRRHLMINQINAPFVEAFRWLCQYCIQAVAYRTLATSFLFGCGSLLFPAA